MIERRKVTSLIKSRICILSVSFVVFAFVSATVKIAALSPEFSISEKKEKPELKDDALEGPLAAQSAAAAEAKALFTDGPQRGPHVIWGPGAERGEQTRGFDAEDDSKSGQVKEPPKFDRCEHKIESLVGSLKWRNIQKTLRWLNRVLSSNHTNKILCGRRKIHEPKTSFVNAKSNNYEFYSPRKRKKPKPDVEPPSNRPEADKKMKKKRKHKHKSWRNLSRNETRKLKTKWKGPRHQRKNSPDSSPIQQDASAIPKPNSALSNVEPELPKKTKSRNGCPYANPKFSAVKAERSCVESKKSRKASLGSDRKSARPKQGRSGKPEARANDPGGKLPKQKAKPWPHFVYHRVSSNFLHPEPAGHSHRQSAYVAISVATSSKPDTTDNNA